MTEPHLLTQNDSGTGLIGRCDLCGNARTDLKLAMVVNGVGLYLGECCDEGEIQANIANYLTAKEQANEIHRDAI